MSLSAASASHHPQTFTFTAHPRWREGARRRDLHPALGSGCTAETGAQVKRHLGSKGTSREPAPSEPVSRSHEQVFFLVFFFRFRFPSFLAVCSVHANPSLDRDCQDDTSCHLGRVVSPCDDKLSPACTWYRARTRTHERTSSSRSCRSLDLHVVSDPSVLIPCLSTPRLVMLFAPFLPLRPTGGGGGGGEDQSPRRDTHSPKQVGALAHAWRCHCAVRRNAGLFLSAVSLHR